MTTSPSAPRAAQVVLCTYPYLWWGLYSTLLAQRRKKLGPQAPQAGEKKRG